MSFIIQKQGGEDVKRDKIGTATSADVTYLLSGYSSSILAQAAFDTYIGNTYTVAGTALTLAGNDLKHVECEHWEATAHYSTPQTQGDGDNGDDLPELSFNITGATVHKTHGYEVVASYPARAPKDLFGGAINVEKDSKGRLKVNGVDDEESELEFTCDFKIPKPFDPFAFARQLANVSNHINGTVWYGFLPGEVLFKAATVKGKLGEKWQMQYVFAASPSVFINVEFIDGPVNCFKRGFDYFWIHYEAKVKEINGGAKLIVPAPVYAFSHRMKQEAEFRILGIGG